MGVASGPGWEFSEELLSNKTLLHLDMDVICRDTIRLTLVLGKRYLSPQLAQPQHSQSPLGISSMLAATRQVCLCEMD